VVSRPLSRYTSSLHPIAVASAGNRRRGARRRRLRSHALLLATPLLIVLVLIELSDIVFAMDSILAIFAITTDPFIVLTSNIFALLGMRSLYFLLANLARRFVYLQPGLALVLISWS
jgi:tellurite resistance protein TerC